MSRPKSLDKIQLTLYSKEVERYISEGKSLNDAAKGLGWTLEDIEELIASEEFAKTVDPELLATLAAQSATAKDLAREAVDYANRRVKRYLMWLDDLAEKAQSEQVRLSAISKLLDFTTLRVAAAEVEPFQVSEEDLERLHKTLDDIDGLGRTE